MRHNLNSRKPEAVLYAEWALWLWTAWTCFFGAYQSWLSIPEMEKTINEQMPGLLTFEPKHVLFVVIAGYVLMAILSIPFVLQIGAGKHWARSSLLLGVGLQLAWEMFPPYHSLIDYVKDAPDFGLQIFALYLVYTKPGARWFEPEGVSGSR